MAALDFPASSASPWTAPNGVIYTWNADGYWEASPTDADYLKLDATNGPVTGPLTFEGTTTHKDGVEVTGGSNSVAAYGIGQGGDSLVLTAGGERTISAKDGRAVSLGGLDAYGDAIVSIRSTPDPKYTTDLYGVRFNVPDAPNLTSSSNVYGFEARYNATKSLNSFTGFIAQKGTWGAGVGASELKGFAVEDGFSNDAGTAYGFWSNIGTNGDVANPFNFYAGGDAPNFFAGSTTFGTTELNPPAVQIVGTSIRGQYGQILQYFGNNNVENRIRRGNSDGAYIEFQSGAPTSNGSIRQINQDLQYWVRTTRGGFYRNADRRELGTLTSFADASSAIKQLQPGVEGFIADEVETIFPDAVSGTAGATEAIGTYTDVDGNVETEVTEPEAIPFGSTWQQTGTRDVLQGIDQTKLIPLLTKALQEALERIEQLEALVAN